jgi:hypothetical protein
MLGIRMPYLMEHRVDLDAAAGLTIYCRRYERRLQAEYRHSE